MSKYLKRLIQQYIRQPFWCIWILFSCICLFSSSAHAVTNIKYQDKGQQQFTLKQKFNYHQQKYQDVLITTFETQARDINDGADRQVIRFLSAIVKDDYNWWQNNWSQATKDDWQAKSVLNKGQRTFNFWKARVNAKSKIELMDFIVIGPTVLVGFNVINDTSEYFLLPLILENNRWRVDQTFMESDLYRQLKQQVI